MPDAPDRESGRSPTGPAPSPSALRAAKSPSLDLGHVLKRSLTIAVQNVVPFHLIAVVIFSPLILLVHLADPSETGIQVGRFRIDPIRPGLFVALPVVLQGALAYGVIQQLRGSRASAWEALSVGARHLFPVLGLSLVLGAMFTIGLSLCVVPYLMLQCMFYVAVPAVVVEGVGVGGALRRSRDLTAGSRWVIWRVLFVMFLILAVVGNALGIAIPDRWVNGQRAVLPLLVAQAAAIPFGVWHAVAATVAYHDLRIAKEGVDIEDLAGVFD